MEPNPNIPNEAVKPGAAKMSTGKIVAIGCSGVVLIAIIVFAIFCWKVYKSPEFQEAFQESFKESLQEARAQAEQAKRDAATGR